MNKYVKYLLAVATLIIACATFALADSPVVATLNGQPYSDLYDAVSAARPGDHLSLVSNTTLSRNLNISNGVYFDIPRGITLNVDEFIVSSAGNFTLYGDIIRPVLTASSGNTVQIDAGSLDVYGSIINTGYGKCIRLPSSSSGTVNIYDGRFICPESQGFPISAASGLVTVYGGSFSPSIILGDHIVLAPGVSLFEEGAVASFGPLQFIANLVSSGVLWIQLFCATIVDNKLLLIFVIFFMGFAGVGLIKRIIR